MKLATLHDGSRDGALAVVSRDGSLAHAAAHVAGTLQRVLDDWNFLSPQLEDLSTTLNQGKARHAFAFEPRLAAAPLPRAVRWVTFDAAGAAPVERAADALHGPLPVLPAAADGATPQAWLVAAMGDLAPGADAGAALDAVRLLLLAVAWPGRGVPVAFAPCAVTPDEAGAAWRDGRLHAALCDAAGRPRFDAAAAPALGPAIASLAAERALTCGTLLGVPLPLAGGAEPAAAARTLWLAAPDGSDLFGPVQARSAGVPAPAEPAELA
jgi:fumarylacetoacetate (FAA) hydrolase